MDAVIKEKSDELHWFCEHYSDLVHRMRSTLHSYDNNNQCPHHLEDDVWSHTLLTLKSIDVNDVPNYNDRLILYYSALLHDVGKIFKRNSHAPGKISFFGHDEYSTQIALEVMVNRFNRDISYDVSKDEIDNILYIVGKHDVCLREKDPYNVGLLMNDNHRLLYFYYKFKEADDNGRFYIKNDNDIQWYDSVYTYKEYEPLIEKNLNHVVFCGVPGSGKNFMAKADNFEIISYDQIRMDIFKQYKNINNLNPADAYNQAYDYCKNNKGNLYKELVDRVINSTSKRIAICNTNTSIKARRDCIKAFKERFDRLGTYNEIECRFVLNTRKNCINNDLNRSEDDKLVSEEVIDKFLCNINLPTMHEGFGQVKLIKSEQLWK